jgi:chaperonin GroES
VVKVGEAKKDEPVIVKVGNTVLYGKYSGTELTIDGNDYLLMNQSDILYIE